MVLFLGSASPGQGGQALRSEVKDRRRPAVFDETTNRLEVTDIELTSSPFPAISSKAIVGPGDQHGAFMRCQGLRSVHGVSRRYRRICQVSHPRSVNFTGPASPPAASSAVISLRRSSGETINIRKPPPPAPDTFPASAPLVKATLHSLSMRSFETPEAVIFFAAHESSRIRAIPSMLPTSNAFFIAIASAFRRSIAVIVFSLWSAIPAVCCAI